MAITFTDAIRYSTSTIPLLFGQTTASISFWFRYESSGGLSFSTDQPLLTQYQDDIYSYLAASGSQVTFSFTFASSTGDAGCSFACVPGVPYHIALTWDQGSQVVYQNGNASSFGTRTGSIGYGSRVFWLGGTSTGLKYTFDDLAMWKGYALTQSDVLSLRGGTPPSSLATPCSMHWTLAGSPGTTPILGASGLVEANHLPGDFSTSFTSVSGTGSAVYATNLTYSVPAKINAAHVGTSGEMVFLYPTSTSGAITTLTSFTSYPSISINGVNKGTLGFLWNTKNHDCIGFQTPANVSVVAGDTVTLNATDGWAMSALGQVQGLSNFAVTNNTGKSCFGSDTYPHTLAMGLNFAHLGTSYYTMYNLFKDWRRRASPWSGLSVVSPDGYPTQLSGTTASTLLYSQGGGNDIDGTGYPGPKGLFAIQWDDPNGTDTFALAAGNGHTTVTERTDLANPGDGSGNGKCRVFNVQLSTGQSLVDTGISMQLTCTAGNHQPGFRNLYVYGPGDFAYAANQPTSLDYSNPYALSNFTLSRLSTGIGSARFADSVLSYMGQTPITEVEQIRALEDFSWGAGRETLSCSFSQLRPFVPTSSTYIYAGWFGSAYNVTLSTGIGTTDTSLTIGVIDSPVFRGQILTAGSEKMRIKGVSGTGSSLTVTVERGSLGTTAASHSSGTITCTGRLSIPSMAAMGSGYVVMEWVSSTPHNMVTGSYLKINGNWSGAPTITYTVGGNASTVPYYYLVPSNPAVFVTSPTTVLVWVTNIGGSGVYTIDQTVNLDATGATAPNANSLVYVPDTAGFPYEGAAKVAGSFPGCVIHLNIPMGCSDALCDEIARRVRDNFPAGREVWLELSNECWNYTSGQMEWSFFSLLTNVLGYTTGASPYPAVVWRSGQLKARFQSIFGARSSEIKLLIGGFMWDNGITSWILTQAQRFSVVVDAVAIAPYINPDNSPSTMLAFNQADVPRACDIWIHDLWGRQANSFPGMFAAHSAAIAGYNASTGGNCKLYGYEGGLETAYPSPPTSVWAFLASAITTTPVAGTTETASLTNVAVTGTAATDNGITGGIYMSVDSEIFLVTSSTANTVTWQRGALGSTPATHGAGAYLHYALLTHRSRDIQFHPNWYIIEQDMYKLFQTAGFYHLNLYSYDMTYASPALWGLYVHSYQHSGRGDHSDGKSDNRLCLATPGQANTKPGTTNQDLTNVSVRGLALKDWNRGAKYYRKFGFTQGFTP